MIRYSCLIRETPEACPVSGVDGSADSSWIRRDWITRSVAPAAVTVPRNTSSAFLAAFANVTASASVSAK